MAFLGSMALSGCSLLSNAAWKKHETPPVVAAPEPPTQALPVATHRFEFDPDRDDVVGRVQTTVVGKEDTLPEIARRFNLGYEEIIRANPGVDPWLPGEGREIVLPTRFVLPSGARQGVVINVPAMRFFYFPPHKAGEPAVVITHPIGIGKVGWATPEGTTKILRRTKDPKWTVPLSVRKEHRENGEELPAVVPPGPDNPLGRYSLTLAWPSYLIHGTNKPYGVGMRSSHGCIRLYPEDIEQIFGSVPIGTQVRVVNQPFIFGRVGPVGAAENALGEQQHGLVMQAYDILEDDKRDWQKSHRKLLDKTLSASVRKVLKERALQIDWQRVEALAAKPRGVPVSVVEPADSPASSIEAVVASALKVQNVLPSGATWDGQVSPDEFNLQDLLSDKEPQSDVPAGAVATPVTDVRSSAGGKVGVSAAKKSDSSGNE